ncbi:MAG: hypothetical protein ABI187_04210 [Ornithinibacter sp.]
MSFLERAKAAANELAAKADVAMSNAGLNTPTGGGGGGGGERALRDLGVIAWLDATGRPVAESDRERVMTALRRMEDAGQLGGLTVSQAPPAPAGPPPPPGAAATGWSPPPPPPPAGPAGPSGASGQPLQQPPAPHQEAPGAAPGSTPPPPPPSWATPPTSDS